MSIMLLLSVCPPVSAEGTAPVAVLQFGDENGQVTQLQTRLNELGYYTIKITGKYLDYTKKAVEDFQADYGLVVTGIADEITLTRLETAKYRALRRGDYGNDVKALQTRLKELGYYSGNVSGDFKDGTYAAVGSFQFKSGLDVTYEADITTQEALFADTAISLYTPAPTAAITPVPTPGPDGTTPAPEPVATVAYNGVALEYGDTGNNVKKVQQRLADLSYFSGPVNGNFYSQTQAAVKAFQKNNGITQDGVVGATTWNAMFNDPEVSAAGDPPKEQPPATPVPYYILVDVTNQVVTVYSRDSEGEFTNIERRMACSSGTTGYPTPSGVFYTTGRRALWAYFDRWGGYARYWTQVTSEFAFHSPCYRIEGDDKSLNVSSFKKLGSRASHGCIRVPLTDARWIYTNCRVGTIVEVRYDLPNDQELAKSVKPGALNKDTMMSYVTPTPSPAPVYDPNGMPPQPFRTMETGDSGVDVYWLQCKLRDLGYYTGTVTGSYYSGTAAAVKAFQKANGLSADGIAGKKTLNAIYDDILNPPTPEPTPEPMPQPTAEPVLTETPVPENSSI